MLAETEEKDGLPAFPFALVYMQIGEYDRAFEYLEQAYAK